MTVAAVKDPVTREPRQLRVTRGGPQVSETQDSDARAQLREQQLLLTQETDELILDLTKTLAETLQFILTRTRQVLNASHVDIMFGYADGLRVEGSSDPAEIGRFVPIDRSISGLVLSSRAPVVVNDLRNDPVLSERYFPRAEMDPGTQAPPLSVLVAEVTLDGQAIGVINVEAAPDNRFGESHLEFAIASPGRSPWRLPTRRSSTRTISGPPPIACSSKRPAGITTWSCGKSSITS
jgi:hypothetical protein